MLVCSVRSVSMTRGSQGGVALLLLFAERVAAWLARPAHAESMAADYARLRERLLS